MSTEDQIVKPMETSIRLTGEPSEQHYRLQEGTQQQNPISSTTIVS